MRVAADLRSRRWRRTVVVAAVALAVLAAIAAVLGVSTARHAGGGRPAAPLATASTTHGFAVGASAWHGPAWSGLLVVRPRQHRCLEVPLPQASPGYLVFAGTRYAYVPNGRIVRVGRIGSGRPRKLQLSYLATPVWVAGKLGLVERAAPRLHFGGRTITFGVPAGAVVEEPAFSRGRFVFDASWGDGRAGELQAGTFVYANGRTREVRVNPTPYGGDSGAAPIWSPDGQRIAFLEDGDLWTMAFDGGRPRRLTHSPRLAKGGPLLWSHDGRTIVYQAMRGRLLDVYAEPATGGTPMRLTRSLPPAPNQAVDLLGTKQLTWVGPATLAVLSGDSIGLLALSGGSVERVCTMPGTGFTNATALPG